MIVNLDTAMNSLLYSLCYSNLHLDSILHLAGPRIRALIDSDYVFAVSLYMARFFSPLFDVCDQLGLPRDNPIHLQFFHNLLALSLGKAAEPCFLWCTTLSQRERQNGWHLWHCGLRLRSIRQACRHDLVPRA